MELFSLLVITATRIQYKAFWILIQ